MAASNALPHVPDASARHVKLEIGNNASPEVWTELAYVTDIQLPAMKRTPIETTNVQSPSGYREFIPGLKEVGTLTVSIFWNPSVTTHGVDAGGLLTLFDQVGLNAFRIVWPDAARTVFQGVGFVIKNGLKAMLDKSVAGDIEIQISGPWTYSTGGT